MVAVVGSRVVRYDEVDGLRARVVGRVRVVAVGEGTGIRGGGSNGTVATAWRMRQRRDRAAVGGVGGVSTMEARTTRVRGTSEVGVELLEVGGLVSDLHE